MSTLNTLPENSNFNIRICDERWTMPFNSYLRGFEPFLTPLKRFSLHCLVDIETMSNLVSLGYNPADPFLMDGLVLDGDPDPRVESIRTSFINFKTKLNKSFSQTEDEFIINPQFFNFQNFIAENKFSISYAEKLLDLRNNVVYQGDKIKEESNKKLMSDTLFGSTPSNYGEARLMWQNLFFLPYDNEITEIEGFQYLKDFYNSTNIINFSNDGDLTFVDPYSARNNEGIQYYNNSFSVRNFKVSIRRHVQLPSKGEFWPASIGWDSGLLLISVNPSSAIDGSPFINLTPNKIFVNNIISPPLNSMTYRRFGISHKTILSRNRRVRSPEIGYGKGGSTEIQGRTPINNSISKPSLINISKKNQSNQAIVNQNFNIFTIGSSKSRSEV